jgi:hypothetical protein
MYATVRGKNPLEWPRDKKAEAEFGKKERAYLRRLARGK